MWCEVCGKVCTHAVRYVGKCVRISGEGRGGLGHMEKHVSLLQGFVKKPKTWLR